MLRSLKKAGMDNFMKMTKKAGHTGEIQRLIDLHSVFANALDHKLIVAPLDLKVPGKRILEAGTADGCWLLDVRRSAPAPHQYFGTDIEPELFPTEPCGIEFSQQSFNDAWPAELRKSMDLVHLRGSMAGSSPNSPLETVKKLKTIVKPGGWIQLQELNAFNPPKSGPAMTDFARMAKQVWTGIKVGDFANELKTYLEQAGLQNVQEKRIICELGKTTKPELFESSINGTSSPIKPLVSIAKTVPTDFTEEELDALQGRVIKELEAEGGRMEAVIAYGQVPFDESVD